MFYKLFRSFLSILKSFVIKIVTINRISIKITTNMHLRSEIKSIEGGKIFIGRGLHTKAGCSITSSSILKIGNKVFFNRNCIVACRHDIEIGDGCAFGPNVCIYDHDHDFGNEGMISGKYKYGKVLIGQNCWIGAGVIILKGSSIGKNCIVGAGAIIKGKIPDNSLVIPERSNIIKSL
jgi:acetyltransferase-like isoleucine patch superfamily enzyme